MFSVVELYFCDFVVPSNEMRIPSRTHLLSRSQGFDFIHRGGGVAINQHNPLVAPLPGTNSRRASVTGSTNGSTGYGIVHCSAVGMLTVKSEK